MLNFLRFERSSDPGRAKTELVPSEQRHSPPQSPGSGGMRHAAPRSSKCAPSALTACAAPSEPVPKPNDGALTFARKKAWYVPFSQMAHVSHWLLTLWD